MRPSRYEPLLKIASGGMGTVHLGVVRGRSAPLLAIKIPHRHLLDDPSFRRALAREGAIAARLRDPHVVGLLGVDEEGETALAMEYVEGAPLGDLIANAAKRDTRSPPAVALRIVLDACAGLSAVHSLAGEDGAPLGLVHRDVSPQNILVGADGIAKLADFGLAKSLSTDPSTTQDTLKGKLGYLAPEYVRGRPVDARIDLFALGVVLWEALAGRRLFRGANDADTLERVLRAEIPPLAAIDPALAPFDPIATRLLARDPAARPPTARAAEAELRAVAEATGLLAEPLAVAIVVEEVFGAELRARRSAIAGTLRARKRRRLALIGGTSFAVGTAALAAFAFAVHRAPTPTAAPPPPSAQAPLASAEPRPSAPNAIGIDELPLATASTAALTRPPTSPPPAVTSGRRSPPPNPYRTH